MRNNFCLGDECPPGEDGSCRGRQLSDSRTTASSLYGSCYNPPHTLKCPFSTGKTAGLTLSLQKWARYTWCSADVMQLCDVHNCAEQGGRLLLQKWCLFVCGRRGDSLYGLPVVDSKDRTAENHWQQRRAETKVQRLFTKLDELLPSIGLEESVE